MKCRKALLSEEELLVRDKANKVSKRASEKETREQTLDLQPRTELYTYDKHKHLSYSLHQDSLVSRPHPRGEGLVTSG